MKKRFFTIGALALTLAVVIGYGVKTSMNNDVQLNDLAMANIEALATPEASFLNCSLAGCFWNPFWDCHIYRQIMGGIWIREFTCEKTRN